MKEPGGHDLAPRYFPGAGSLRVAADRNCQYEATFAEILSKQCGWVFFCQAFLLVVHEKKSVPDPAKKQTRNEHKKSPVSRARFQGSLTYFVATAFLLRFTFLGVSGCGSFAWA